MKVLNKRWIIAGLCAIAVGAAGYQVLRSRGGAGFAPAPAVSVRASLASGHSALNPQLSTASTQTAAVTWLIDRGYVKSHLAQWIKGPRRDPFLRSTVAEYVAAATSPVSGWKLKAIWHQTGSRLAVINNDVYAEGDLIEGYKLETIESDGVWVRGPTGREGLGFAKSKPKVTPSASTQSPSTINFSYEHNKSR